MKLTADTITDEQIRELWRTGVIGHGEGDAMKLRSARAACDEACKAAAYANPDGNEIEHLNHALLEAGRALGLALIARARCAEILNARRAVKP